MEYTVYLRTNTVNGKCYVGQTGDFKQRQWEWNCFKKTYANDYIDEDREKYGLDAWTVETLAETENREDAWELEQRFIKDYNTLWPNGYNITEGGAGSKGCKHTDETKQKISEAKKGKPSPMKGKHHTGETKQKMSEAHKGTHHADKAKQKISEALKIPVYQYTLDGKLVAIWKSATDAAEKLGINQSNISACCRGKRKSAGGFRWSFIKL